MTKLSIREASGPRGTQPPRSRRRTEQPACTSAWAANAPPNPLPMTIASNGPIMNEGPGASITPVVVAAETVVGFTGITREHSMKYSKAATLTRSVLAGATIGMAGCVGWRTEPVTPRELLSDSEVRAVRIVKPDNTRIEVWDPTLVGDSIRGHPTERAIARFSVPLSSVQSIETRHTSIGKTFLAVLGIGAGVVVYALIQSLNTY